MRKRAASLAAGVALGLSPVLLSSAGLAQDQMDDAVPDFLPRSMTVSWTNQDGSLLTTSFDPSKTQPGVYVLSGSYINNATGYSCRGSAYPIGGLFYAATGMVSFAVAWSNSVEDCQSVTGWTGYIDSSSTDVTMTTDWNLAYQGAGGPAIDQGEDSFMLTTVARSSSLMAQ